MSTEYQDWLPTLCALAETAGERIMDIYRSDFDVEHKADDSPLTAADQASHQALVEGLKALTPDVPILSEEGEQPDFAVRREWQRYWLIDPLDGTREFIKRNDEFTVNIALIENRRAVVGVVYAPALDALYYGAAGIGAYQRTDGKQEAITTRAVPAAVTAVVSRSHRGERVEGLLERLPGHTTRSVGSSLKFCLVAAGEADLYPRLGPTSEWDTAAAQCVVEAAGGRVVKLDGSPLEYNSKESLLNPDFLVVGDAQHDWVGLVAGLEEGRS